MTPAGAVTTEPDEPGQEPGALVRALERLTKFINRWLAWAAGLVLAAMMLFSVSDMVLRSLGHTVPGSYELIGWLSASAMALALGSVQEYRGHVAMELLVTRLGPRMRTVVDMVTGLLSFLLFAAVAWYVARYALVLHKTGSLSETLRVVVYPWVYVVAGGCAGLALALLVDFLRAVGRLLALRIPQR
jgi:TRAP-type C4-dicarboxylate transport system permease small subunit